MAAAAVVVVVVDFVEDTTAGFVVVVVDEAGDVFEAGTVVNEIECSGGHVVLVHVPPDHTAEAVSVPVVMLLT